MNENIERHTYNIDEYEDEYILFCEDCKTYIPLEGETVEERTVDMFNAMLSFKWEGCESSPSGMHERIRKLVKQSMNDAFSP